MVFAISRGSFLEKMINLGVPISIPAHWSFSLHFQPYRTGWGFKKAGGVSLQKLPFTRCHPLCSAQRLCTLPLCLHLSVPFCHCPSKNWFKQKQGRQGRRQADPTEERQGRFSLKVTYRTLLNSCFHIARIQMLKILPPLLAPTPPQCDYIWK